MTNFLISLVGMILGLSMIKFRERVADMIGDAYWMRYVGGVYNLVILVGVIIFFFSVAKMTGTTNFFLTPLTYILPSSGQPPPPPTNTF